MTKPELPELSEEKFHRLAYSNWDFQQALSALTFLREDCDLKRQYTKVQLRRFKCYENQTIMSFCRPFAQSRSGVQLSLRLIGVKLSDSERTLKDRLLYLRNKVVAHSDSDEMHYKGVPIDVGDDVEFRAPLFLYDEGLDLTEEDREVLDFLIRKLMRGIAQVSVGLCRSDPDRFDVYRKPKSFRGSSS